MMSTAWKCFDLPRQISYDFTDGESKVTQIKFAQGVNIKKLSLQVYLPDRDDQQVVIDKPIKFQVQTVTASNGEKAGKREPGDYPSRKSERSKCVQTTSTTKRPSAKKWLWT